MDPERQVVIVGVGRYTQRDHDVETAKNPIEMIKTSALLAAADAMGGDRRAGENLLKDAVAIATMSMFLEMRWRAQFGSKMYRNMPRKVADSIGANPIPQMCWRSAPGGNGPQMLVNTFAGLLSRGKIAQRGPILIAGCEVNKTFDTAVRDGIAGRLKVKGWCDNENDPVGERPVSFNRHERSPAMMPAIFQLFGTVKETSHVYAMFENAARHIDEKDKDGDLSARLLSGFSRVAALSPAHAWYPQERGADEVKKPSENNFIVSAPYTKSMCAIDRVDQSAALLLMSVAEARRRGISDARFVYLWGSGDARDTECFPLRHRLDRSVAMRAAYEEAFRAAGFSLRRDATRIVATCDLYSCYPIAVKNAIRCLGFDMETVDPARICQTGGLPYHGGPGNNYVTHAICALVETMRSRPRDGRFGLIGANGGFLTEHSVGLYSSQPPPRTFSRSGPETYTVDCGLPWTMLARAPTGRGRVLAWTVVYKRRPRNVPDRALVIGTMTSGSDEGKRFIGWTEQGDEDTVRWFLERDRVGQDLHVFCAAEDMKVFRGKIEIKRVLVRAYTRSLL